MGFPVEEERVAEAEGKLGRQLPPELRVRLMRENGGEVEVRGYPGDDPVWQLHPVWDPSDRKRAKRSANHVVRETQESVDDLPEGTVVIAGNGTGDLLVLVLDDDQPHWWDHETGELHPVTVDWS
jgi:hypothetical protein